jgi:hypothetical protein
MTSPRVALSLYCMLGLACASSQEEETDNARRLYELRVPATASNATAYGALLDAGEGVFATLGTKLVYVPKDGGPASTVTEAPRFHPSLVADENFVYFATQETDRTGYKTPYGDFLPESRIPTRRDGIVWRVSKRAPFTAEALNDVFLIAGSIAVHGGHLFLCESPGLDGQGRLVDIDLIDARLTTRHMFRANEFCTGVIAAAGKLTLLMDRMSRKDVPAERSLVLSTAQRDGVPFSTQAGPPVVKELNIERADSFAASSGGFVIGNSYGGLRTYDSAGNLTASVETPTAPVATGDARKVFWASPARGGKDGGELCEGGRVYEQQPGGAPKELTQNVCYPTAMTRGADATGKPVLYLLERAEVGVGDATPVTRHRLKSLPLLD